MHIQPQHTEALQKLADLIEDFKVAMLTFINEEGQLVSQPMGPLEMDSEGAIWFFTDRHSEKASHLHPMNLAFSGESEAVYVSLSGSAELHFESERKQALWSAFARPWFPQGPDSPDLCLLKFMPHTAEYWDAPHSQVVRLFAMAASIAASRPIGLGEHGRIQHLG